MKKRLLSAVLSLVLLLALIPNVAYASTDEMTADANALYQLGLFNGTGTDAQGNPIFQLDRTPTRYEAVTLLVRLLGRANEAESKEWTTPFTDLTADWAKPYVGYAYENKLTSGTSGTTYGGAGNATVSQYITFVLRALGYESGIDFEWNKAWELSDKLGITNGQYNASTTNFTRGDVVIISFNALSCNIKGTNITLLDDLTARGVVKEQHTHNWATRHIDEVGHMESNGTHWAIKNVCPCGLTVILDSTSDDYQSTFDNWLRHRLDYSCGGYLYYKIQVSDNPHWVVDVPEHDETYCTICGATK